MRKWNWLFWPFGIYLTVFLCLAIPILINPDAYSNYAQTCTVEIAACSDISLNPSILLLAVISLPLAIFAGMLISLAFAIKKIIKKEPKAYSAPKAHH